MLALFRLVSGIEPWMIVSRLGVRDGGSAAFVFSMPGVARVAEAASATTAGVPVGKIVPVGFPPVLMRRGGMEIFHFNCKRLQLLE